MDAFNQRMEIKEESIAASRLAIETICDLSELDAEIRTISDEIAVLVEMSKQLIDENSRNIQNQEEYQQKHAALVAKYETTDARLRELQAERNRRIDVRKNTEWCLEVLSAQENLLEEFDESLFFALTDVMTVWHDGHVTVRFRDGAEIDVPAVAKAKTA